MTETKSAYGTVLLKANQILIAIAVNQASSLSEISQDADITMSTTSKILETLQQINYVIKDEQHKTYTIGPAFLKFNDAFLQEFSIVNLCRPYLSKLRDKFGETVHLGGLENDELVYLDKFSGKKSITVMTSRVGLRAPLYATGMGKAILSTFTKKQLNNYLANHELVALTPTTITDPQILNTQLAEARKNQLTHDDSERDDDVFCIAATICNDRQLLGAFSISIPKYRLDETAKQEMETAILTTKNAIEKRLKA
ncbi:IclR family transcriptional regulator [Lapidilactobacillus bayanensis]|uniref:IclR family transcriptional regulator n=1 Tax=Lapidilactobacillus bayanensis TaxID=2485998 RepID=UPI0013DDDB4E|nr:IclR family transcriptional regulator [Lapidilactobacillus bayanensis]